MNSPAVATTRDLLESSRLVDFVTYEESGKRDRSEDAPQPGVVDLKVAELFEDNGKGMRFRFRLHLGTEDAEYVADIAAEYEFDGVDIREIDPAIRKDFLERVAFMATYPHLRASVFGTSGRMGLERPVLAHVIQGGFSVPNSDEVSAGEV